MPRTIQQNKLIKDKRKSEILNAALELFVKKGFDSVSMDNIANKVKCSHGLIYHYYTNKKDILIDLVIKSHDVISIDFKAIMELDISYYEKYKDVMENLLNVIVSNSHKRYYLFLFFTLPLNKSLSKELTEPTLKLYKKLEDVIKLCQKEGHFKNIKPKELIILHLNYLLGLLYTTVRYPEMVKNLNIQELVKIISR